MGTAGSGAGVHANAARRSVCVTPGGPARRASVLPAEVFPFNSAIGMELASHLNYFRGRASATGIREGSCACALYNAAAHSTGHGVCDPGNARPIVSGRFPSAELCAHAAFRITKKEMQLYVDWHSCSQPGWGSTQRFIAMYSRSCPVLYMKYSA